MKLTRRKFIEASMTAGAFLLVAPLSGCGGDGGGGEDAAASGNTPVNPGVPTSVTLKVPSEGAEHAATWMAFGATVSAWGDDATMVAANRNGSTDLPLTRAMAREDLIRIAAQLSRFEWVNMLVDTSRSVNLNRGDQDLVDANAHVARMVAGVGEKNIIQFTSTPISALTTQSPYQTTANGVPGGRILVASPTTGPDAGKPLPAIRSDRVSFARQPINDLWVRDTAPVFAKGSDGRTYGINFNFNGWGQGFGPNNDGLAPSANNLNGLRQATGLASLFRYDTVKMGPFNTTNGLGGVEFQVIDGDMDVARSIIERTGAAPMSTWLTMEGGGVELSGNGLAIVAKSCVINNNRNPSKTVTEIEGEFNRLLGVRKVYWVPGVRGSEITDGHADFYMRFPAAEASAFATVILATWDGGKVNDNDRQPTSVDALNLSALLASLPGGASPQTTAQENLTYFGSAGPVVKVWQPMPAGVPTAVVTLGSLTINQIPISDLPALLRQRDQINIVLLPTPDLSKVKSTVNVRSTGINNALVTYRQSFEITFAAGYVGYYEANRCVVMSQFGDPTNDLLAFQIVQAIYPERYIIQITTDGIANGGGTIHCATQQQII
ncbi:agmatine deiminase family protein [Dyella tabacisoli]|uniref:Agmatine deiminase family protein n=1 Tax=Dyella tabacisoli TaxID=2282381 RepID=A0A369UP92_9GAMM|nr:agmatine deiminase family protein [Dyella tabacisoli]RDD80149.1 hypothetical protein DVJ77_18570 [Dyella tabacisoli]